MCIVCILVGAEIQRARKTKTKHQSMYDDHFRLNVSNWPAMFGSVIPSSWPVPEMANTKEGIFNEPNHSMKKGPQTGICWG